MGKDPLAGEPFKLTVGSPVPVAAPEHTHTHIRHQHAVLLALDINIQLIILQILKRYSLDLLESLVLVVTFLNC